MKKTGSKKSRDTVPLTYAYRAEVGPFEEKLTNARREEDFRSWRAVLKKKVCFYLLSILMEIFQFSLSSKFVLISMK
jgi:hypothetical protein